MENARLDSNFMALILVHSHLVVLLLSRNDCPTPRVFGPKMIVRDQMFINFVDVEIFSR